MLESAVRDLASRRPAGSAQAHRDRVEAEQRAYARCLGLDPEPPRTALNAKVTGTLQREGYRIEKLRYESRPGLLVTAHLYVPDGPGPFPVILMPHGHYEWKKCDAPVQAPAISAALYGFASLVVDSPGYSWDDNEQNERRAMGTHDDAFLCMGSPVQGQYVWDLSRGLDYVETRPDFDLRRVGITGCSGGGTATWMAFGFEHRITAAASVCAASSLQDMPHNGCLCNHLPGILRLGDRSDILAMGHPKPVFVMGALRDDPEFPPEGLRRTADKLKTIYRYEKKDANVRLELFDTGHDYNRRMRESMLAFFVQHLNGEQERPYLPEKRPLTDGALNPYPANTEDPHNPDLIVTEPWDRATVGFRDLLAKALDEPYPDPAPYSSRWLPWSKYGHGIQVPTGETLQLFDLPAQVPEQGLGLPTDSIDQRSCIHIGLSIPEFYAQLLHGSLPGMPEGWEGGALSGEGIGAVIASVKTLVGAARPEPPPTAVQAHGPLASMTALFLKALRPDLKLETSHEFSSWKDVLAFGNPLLSQPGARYLRFPS